MMIRKVVPLCALLATALLVEPAAAQFTGITLPPSGDNQRSFVAQNIGLVRVSVDYSSPDVHSPTGEDRAGKIWGKLVPYGMANLGFGTCGDQCPWRGGANENTVFTTSHDIKVQGQPLPAGSYGLHFIAGPEEWTVIFSKNYTSWGSFFYDAKEDALRVQAKPEKNAYHEWLTYEFTDRHPDKATVALEWENLQLPIAITVPNAADLYVENIRRELRSSAGFAWPGWYAAALYTLQSKVHLDQGLAWAKEGVSQQKNFLTLSTLARLQDANGLADEGRKTMEAALSDPTATAIDVHQYGRELQAEKKNEEAMKVFELNARLHPGVWPVEVGLARGHMGLGHKKEALQHARLALAKAPDDASRANVANLIKTIEESKD
jgi:hypothetical protein